MDYNYTFLVIEDNFIDQIITTTLLKKTLTTPNINIANNGQEAIYWLQTNWGKLDKSLIIISDIEMPVMDGLEFLSNFDKLSDELKNETQIFMLSSTLCKNKINEGKSNPYVKDVFSKPLPIERLLTMIFPKQQKQA